MRRITAERKARGLSIAALSRMTGMNASTIGQIESGYIGNPYPKQLAVLCAALGWPLDRANGLLEEVEQDE